ncbi:OLC1v1033135C1 [Oldenlandia corymbosa var. corymbosa]|uniref:OLC1v1033135C1 n=1 Tax=Oldenlandia corymbosa var. corymbosa TaxID=529605 RepID=A0AAV1CMJ7_OLDCO|nr:OLC1v1033135C1 [Oldenlandia corymbosa var. corymbosa]
MEPTTCSDWSALPPDLVEEIATRLTDLEDFIAFRGVCAAWRVATKDSCPRVPLLMLPEKRQNDEREFYSLSERKVSMRLSLPEAKGKLCVEAGFGWLLTLSLDSGDVTLLNPFSRAQIQLPNAVTFTFPEHLDHKEPNLYNFARKAVLSENPSKLSADFILLVIHGTIHADIGILCFWRPGDTTWTQLESRKGIHWRKLGYYKGTFRDVNYLNGKFYAINVLGHIWAWDGDRHRPPTWIWDGYKPPEPKVHACYKPIDCDRRVNLYGDLYLAKSSSSSFNGSKRGGDLLVIRRKIVHCDHMPDNWTWNFNIYRLDMTRGGGWEDEITSLGGDAIFVGDNTTISIPYAETKRSGIKGDCIYFSYTALDHFTEEEISKSRMGIYNINDGSMEPILDEVQVTSDFIECPPLWVNSPIFL